MTAISFSSLESSNSIFEFKRDSDELTSRSTLVSLFVSLSAPVVFASSVCDGQVDNYIKALSLVDSSISLEKGPTFLAKIGNVAGDEGTTEKVEVFQRRTSVLQSIQVSLLPEQNCSLHSVSFSFTHTDDGV